MLLDVIVPCHNEEKNVSLLLEKLKENLKDIKYNVIYINDGSSDKTIDVLNDLYNENKNIVKVINFSRNFGKDAAIYAGLYHSKAKYVTIIDADLQQNPKYIVKMLSFIINNPDYDQVAMVNNTRKNDNFINKIFKKGFYKFINKLSDTKLKQDASDFRLFTKEMKESILMLGENNRFSKGIFAWVGFNTKFMIYDVEKRYSGKTNFNFKKSLKYGINGIINFSTKPLRIATAFGSVCSLGAFIYFLIIIIKTLIKGSALPGYPSLICVILLLGGLILLSIGILGEYIAKMYLEIKKRPIYVAKNKLGFDEDIL